MFEKIRNFLLKRRNAYKTVFDVNNPFTKEVLKDLARFCRAHDSTFHTDPRAHAVLEGRREVWLRILKHTDFTQEDFLKFYGKGEIIDE